MVEVIKKSARPSLARFVGMVRYLALIQLFGFATDIARSAPNVLIQFLSAVNLYRLMVEDIIMIFYSRDVLEIVSNP